MRHRFSAPTEERLDRLIAAHTPLSRNRARSLIEQGGVRVDGAIANAPWHQVSAGAMVEVRSVPAPERAPELVERYRDPWLLVVDKPSGLPSQPTPDGSRLHVYGIVSGRERYASLLHRLDTPASGLMLLALSPAMNVPLSRAFQEHTIVRRYLGVVVGDPGEAGRWDSPLDEESAATRWRRGGLGEGLSALEFELETGRTHQIRRHTAMAGYPLAGDRRYGGAAGRAWPRLALHAVGLEFAHPITGAPISVRAPIPEDLAALFARAGYSDGGFTGAGPRM